MSKDMSRDMNKNPFLDFFFLFFYLLLCLYCRASLLVVFPPVRHKLDLVFENQIDHVPISRMMHEFFAKLCIAVSHSDFVEIVHQLNCLVDTIVAHNCVDLVLGKVLNVIINPVIYFVCCLIVLGKLVVLDFEEGNLVPVLDGDLLVNLRKDIGVQLLELGGFGRRDSCGKRHVVSNGKFLNKHSFFLNFCPKW